MTIITRRAALRGIAALGAAGSAGIQQAGAASDEQKLEACLAELEAALKRLHPIATEVSFGYYPQEDGTFRLWTTCKREFLEYSGPGFYRISDVGYIMTWWLERTEERTLSGRFIGYVFLADMYLEDEGGFVGERRRMWEPKIVEKLEGLEA